MTKVDKELIEELVQLMLECIKLRAENQMLKEALEEKEKGTVN